MGKVRVSKRPEERRAELIAAARRLFDQDGVDKTRVSDIVHAVGVAQGVFYYYFRSKEEIVEAVVEVVIAELEADIDGVFADQGADFYKKLSGLLELYFDLVDQFTADQALALPDLGQEGRAGSSPVGRAMAVLLLHIQRLVAQGARDGQVLARHPQWTVEVMEAGLRHMAAAALPTRQMVYALAEQALALPWGSLMAHCPESG